MTDIAASNVAVTIQFSDLTKRRRRMEIKLVFGNASLTYPTNGVPLPAKKLLGFHSHIDRVEIQQPPAGYIYSFDPTNYTIRIFQVGSAGALAEFSGAIAATTLYLTIYGA